MATPWVIPKMWDKKTVVILASGPSLSKDVVEAVRAVRKRVKTICINNTYQLTPWADMLYAADSAWWYKYPEARKNDYLKVTCNNSVPFRDVLLVRNTGKTGFDPNPGCLRDGRNSGYQATHIAMHAGASKILLCGVDMTIKHGVHWHGLHEPGLSNPSEEFLTRCREYWKGLVGPSKVLRCEIVVCSAISALTCFRRSTIKEEL